jgi:glutamate racemase
MLFSCQKRATYDLLEPHKPLIDHVTQKNSSFYSISKKNQSKPDKKLAIGVFDSGIGGLTVFDAMINIDFYNSDHQNQPDGIRDFQHEQFVYLADQANMPYSNYAEEGKELLLAEHILKDALFLLNNRYHPNPGSPETANDKPAIKAMVIACNTATAYGKPHVEELCRVLDNNIRVIGVIDAGCKGAIDLIDAGEKATIAVFATPATVKSMAYVNTLSQVKKGHTGTIHIIQQGGKGLHESIDNKPGFIGRHYTKPYDEYQGPSLNSELYKIEKELLPYYCFDTTANHLLCNRNPLKSADTIALNSVENYARYHMVSIVEQLRKQKNPTPLKAVILGCTHYPYVTDLLSVITDELRATDRYRPLIADTVYFVDPAINTAKELYAHLN